MFLCCHRWQGASPFFVLAAPASVICTIVDCLRLLPRSFVHCAAGVPNVGVYPCIRMEPPDALLPVWPVPQLVLPPGEGNGVAFLTNVQGESFRHAVESGLKAHRQEHPLEQHTCKIKR